MHPAVELLLKRMESNPEEFADRGKHILHSSTNRWIAIVNKYKEFLTTEEKNAINAKQREIAMSAMHQDIMGELLCNTAESVAVSIKPGAAGNNYSLDFDNPFSFAERYGYGPSERIEPTLSES